MARRRFRYNAALGRMVEITEDVIDHTAPFIHGDVPAFRSPLDGSVVEGRRAYAEHMKKHDVVPFEKGMEKATPPRVDPQPRRELIWETVDRSMQRRGR